MNLYKLSAIEARDAIVRGEITPVELIKSCLKRIANREEEVQAWTYLDPDYAIEQAETLSAARRAGEPMGPLFGIPVGVKDIFDTRDMPTENGTLLHQGRSPDRDATVVACLRKAGAIIMGKTVTTELAVYAPGKTRNPHNPDHTPGGSSSGSAASVACYMVPLALGTQTNGSVIRPASFCGVVGFKPTYGRISRDGVLKLSPTLDQIGVFARDVTDAALLAGVIMDSAEQDTEKAAEARTSFLKNSQSAPILKPKIAFIKSPVWQQADDAARHAFEKLMAVLDETAQEESLPEIFANAVDSHRKIMNADLATYLSSEYAEGMDKLSKTLCGLIEDGQNVSPAEYNEARDSIPRLNNCLDELFKRYDAFVTPAVPGEAPKEHKNTGSPVFATIWTLCGVPAISLPAFLGPHGLPIGVQLVGKRGNDAHLLQTANWLSKRLGKPGVEELLMTPYPAGRATISRG